MPNLDTTDGMWLLAIPALPLTPGFFLDEVPARIYLAHSYEAPWNGWSTPVVDRFALLALLIDSGEPRRLE